DPRCDCRAARGADCRMHRLVSMRGGSFYQPEGGLTVTAYSPTLDLLSPEDAWRYIRFRIARSEPRAVVVRPWPRPPRRGHTGPVDPDRPAPIACPAIP